MHWNYRIEFNNKINNIGLITERTRSLFKFVERNQTYKTKIDS